MEPRTTRPRLRQGDFHHFFHRFGSIESLEAATGGWSLDFCQLDRGQLVADYQQIGTPRAVLSRVRFNRALDQRGCPPPGSLTFGLLEPDGPGLRWCSRETDDLTVLNFNGPGGFESVSRPGHHGFTFSIGTDEFDRLAGILGAERVETCREAIRKASQFRSSGVAALRSLARRLCDTVQRDPARLKDSASFRETLELELSSRLVSAIAGSEAVPNSYRSRRRAVEKARVFIGDRSGSQVTVRQICEHVGVSWRTLDYAFQEQLGVPPRVYLKATRLNEARRQLTAATLPTVADCANHSGFWHMGQFAADYRAQFGELPSATLRRARRCTCPVGGNPRFGS